MNRQPHSGVDQLSEMLRQVKLRRLASFGWKIPLLCFGIAVALTAFLGPSVRNGGVLGMIPGILSVGGILGGLGFSIYAFAKNKSMHEGGLIKHGVWGLIVFILFGTLFLVGLTASFKAKKHNATSENRTERSAVEQPE